VHDVDVITIELEVDAGREDGSATPGPLWRGGDGDEAIGVDLAAAEAGHGFGLSEVITIVVSVGAGAASDLAADAIRTAVKKVIRRSRAGSRHSDGSREGLTDLVEGERSHPPAKRPADE
jgi:hypothetical protein